MAYSIQTAVSNGTLEVLDLSVKYMDKSHIFVYVDDVLVDGSAYSYTWLTDTRIQIVPAVANGSTLKVLRRTLTTEMWHEFSKGARFSTSSMDENFEQLLLVAQEYAEGIYVSDFYTDVNMHLKRITNVGDPVDLYDVVNYKTLQDTLPNADMLPPIISRVAAEEAKSAALAANGITLFDKVVTNFDATNAATNSWLHFAGRDIAGDGVGGWFYYDNLSTTPVNNGTIFAPAVGTGRLFRVLTSYEDVELDWFLPGNYNPDTMSCLNGATNAWLFAVAMKRNLHHSAKRYRVIGESSFPYGRINGLTPTALSDYHGIKVYGEDSATVLETASVDGADVIQLNGADNLEVCHLSTRSYITGASYGSNGISVTGGFDRLKIHDIYPADLAFVDKGDYIDGGKGVSVQTPVAGQTVKCGTMKVWNIYPQGCVYGAGVEIDLATAVTMPMVVDIDLVAQDCREAVVISAGEASAVIPSDWQSGITIRATAIDCMQDVVVSRGHGIKVDCTVVTTKSDAARILSPQGTKWKSTDTVNDVIGLVCSYAHKSDIHIRGHKGSCSYKARVGGNNAGSSGLSAATMDSRITVGLSGFASVADFGAIDSGGNVTARCTLTTYGDTSAPSIEHYLPSRENLIVYGNAQLLSELLVQGAIRFTYNDGKTSYAEIGYDDESITFKQTLGSSGGIRPMRVLNHANANLFAVRNDGGVCMRVNSATTTTGLTGVVAVYDPVTNSLLGYLEVKATAT